MNPDSENFEELRRLLALKRYEQPPPRYFSDFSSRVLDRIRAEQGDRNRAATEGSWWQRLWNALEAKPLFAGAFGTAVCAVLVSGILSSGEFSPGPAGTVIGATDLQPENFTGHTDLVTLPQSMSDSNS